MTDKKISVCVTLLNEEKTISSLLTALANQTLPPDEVIIVDGGSNDATVSIISKSISSDMEFRTKTKKTSMFAGTLKGKHERISTRVFSAIGNRSVGRNCAISQAKNEMIAITDAGCIPSTMWLEELQLEQTRSGAAVVAGYYFAKPATRFEEATIPYVLVMPDKINPHTFLPATRSMLLQKAVWQQLGGFDESLSDNEDYAFAKEIAKKYTISFAEAAKVQWLPRKNVQQFYSMIYRFARGDAFAGIYRPKVVLIALRYMLVAILLLWLLSRTTTLTTTTMAFIAMIFYAFWAIAKNAKYTPSGWYWLPLLQFTSDAAVLHGTYTGLRRRFAT